MKALTLISFLLLFISNATTAHVRWFVSQEERIPSVNFTLDNVSMMILAGAVLFIAFCVLLEVANHRRRIVNTILSRNIKIYHIEWWILIILLSVMFLINGFQGNSLAPNIIFQESMHWLSIYPQILLGIVILFSPLSASILLFFYIPALAIYIPFDVLIDYIFEFAGIILALISAGPKISKIDKAIVKRVRDFPEISLENGIRLLQFFIGLQLLSLAIHNKLLDPGLTLAFVQDNSFYNFMPLLGFNDFSNLHFVFSAGIAEATFGILLITNISERFVISVVALIFLLTAVLTGLHELVGHLPIFGIAIILLANPQRNKLFFRRVAKPGIYLTEAA